MENYVNLRVRIRSENMFIVKIFQRFKSLILENSIYRFKVIVRDIDVGVVEKSKFIMRILNRLRSVVMENFFFNRLLMKIVINIKG